MKQPIAAVLVVVAVAAAACGGFFAGKHLTPKNAAPAPAVENADAKKLAAAQKRIEELEGRIASMKAVAKAPAPKAIPAKTENEDKNVINISGGDVDVLGELKRRMPEEQFAQATNAMEQLKSKLANKAKSRMDFLASIDTSSMTAEERKNHERFMELMERKEAIAAKMKGLIPNVKAIQEMVELEMEMRPTAKRERSTLVRQVAKDLGYTGDDVDVIHDTLNNVYDCTGDGGGLAGIGDMMDEAISIGGEPGAGGKVETIVMPPVIDIQQQPEITPNP